MFLRGGRYHRTVETEPVIGARTDVTRSLRDVAVFTRKRHLAREKRADERQSELIRAARSPAKVAPWPVTEPVSTTQAHRPTHV